MLWLVTICKAYVNKLGVLQLFKEQGDKLVFLLANTNHLRIRLLCSKKLVWLARPLFSVFLCGGGKKGLDQFTGAIRPDTCERVNKLHHKYLHSL